MSAPLKLAARTSGYAGAPVVGKDVLELLSTAMYVDPLTIYREYVQNAADAIDEARRLAAGREDRSRSRRRCPVDRVRDDAPGGFSRERFSEC